VDMKVPGGRPYLMCVCKTHNDDFICICSIMHQHHHTLQHCHVLPQRMLRSTPSFNPSPSLTTTAHVSCSITHHTISLPPPPSSLPPHKPTYLTPSQYQYQANMPTNNKGAFLRGKTFSSKGAFVRTHYPSYWSVLASKLGPHLKEKKKVIENINWKNKTPVCK
jgi:hypothetical protein